MKQLFHILIFFLSFSLYGYAQDASGQSEESLYAQAEQGLALYSEGKYAQACHLLKGVAESGQLDEPSLGMIAYYLCDGYMEWADTMEEGSQERYEAMKESYRWLRQIDWKQFEELSAQDASVSVISSYVLALHSYAITLDDADTAIQLETEAMMLYQTVSDDDMSMATIKAYLHELYMGTKQWDESIRMAKDVEQIVIANGGLVSDLVRLYSNLACIYNQKLEIEESGRYANRVLSCMEGRTEDDMNADERAYYSMALYYLAISYQQVANPVYYDYFKRAYYLIKNTDEARQTRYFRELLLQLVVTARSLNDQEYVTKFLEELVLLCQQYENIDGRFYNEVWIYYIEELSKEPVHHDLAFTLVSDYLTQWNDRNYFTNTDGSDFEEWPFDARVNVYLHAISIMIYDYADDLKSEPESLQSFRSMLEKMDSPNPDICRMLSFLASLQEDWQSCLSFGHKALTHDVLDLDGDLFQLQMMAYSARQLGRFDLLQTYNQSLFDDDKLLLKRNFANVTSEVRSNYWAHAENNFVATISNAMVCNTDMSHQLAYDASLCRKGVLLSAESDLLRIVAQSGDTCLQRKFADLQQIRAVRSSFALQGKESLARYLAVEADKLEAEVLRLSQQYHTLDEMFDITWQDVSRRLSAHETAIEFEQYIDADDCLRYVALVLAHGQVHKVDLFTANELQVLLRDNVYGTETLANQIWTPVLSLVPDAQTIYFAPCDELYNVAIESLPWRGGLVSDALSLVRLSSTRELITVGKNRTKGSGATLYGGLQYDMDVDQMVMDTPAQSGTRGAFASVEPLPGTLDEIQAIAATLLQSSITSVIQSGAEGTERSFKDLSGQSLRIIHIATHGFYNDSEEVSRTSSLSGLAPLQRGISDEDLALTRSGLLFAGAENKLQGEEIPQGVDDGILTAQEISTLDLRSLDLVTLSACETALGDVSGDGVFGLQRGFKKAGVRSILMSLWKVDDLATSRLMTEFYSNWIGRGMTKHDALEAAKQTVRQTPGYEDPRFWAAFILLDGLE